MNLRFLPLLLAALALTPAANAEFINLQYSKHGKHGKHIGISIGYAPKPAPRVWVPGHYEVRCEKVWVEGPEERVYVMPVHETRYDKCGRAYQVELRSGYWMTVKQPGRFEERRVRTWVPGHYRNC